MRRTLMAVTLLLGAACSSPTGIPGTALTVLAQGGSLRLENHSDRRTFYFIYERDAAAVINWAQCVDPSRCPSPLPGGQTGSRARPSGGMSGGSRKR
jgi:hypothetical protein